MLAEIGRGGEEAVRDYARKLDQWTGDIVVTPAEIERRTRDIPEATKRDIDFATAQVRRFALAQRESIREFATEVHPGPHRRPAPDPRQRRRLLRADRPLCAHRVGVHEHRHRQGRRRADGDRVLDAVPRRRPQRRHPSGRALRDARRRRRRDHDAGRRAGDRGDGARAVHRQARRHHRRARQQIRRRGEAHAVRPGRHRRVRRAVGNRGDRRRFRRSAIVATDLVGQAEHGHESPAWLFTTSRAVAEDGDAARAAAHRGAAAHGARCGRRRLARLRRSRARAARARKSREVSDRYASEHLEVHARDLDWWLANLTCYGSLFLGEETTVAFGDKTSGPNHILPTKGAAQYSGGLSVHKFIKTVTWQRMTREANRDVGAGHRAHLAARRHGGARAHRRRPAREILPARALRARRSGEGVSASVTTRARRELFSLDGKVALVTGASSGIGGAIAAAYAEAGAAVVLVARREPELRSRRATPSRPRAAAPPTSPAISRPARRSSRAPRARRSSSVRPTSSSTRPASTSGSRSTRSPKRTGTRVMRDQSRRVVLPAAAARAGDDREGLGPDRQHRIAAVGRARSPTRHRTARRRAASRSSRARRRRRGRATASASTRSRPDSSRRRSPRRWSTIRQRWNAMAAKTFDRPQRRARRPARRRHLPRAAAPPTTSRASRCSSTAASRPASAGGTR